MYSTNNLAKIREILSELINSQYFTNEVSYTHHDFLTRKERKIYETIKRGPIDREDLIKQVFNVSALSAKGLDVHLCNLRRKMKEHNVGEQIVLIDTGVYSIIKT